MNTQTQETVHIDHPGIKALDLADFTEAQPRKEKPKMNTQTQETVIIADRVLTVEEVKKEIDNIDAIRTSILYYAPPTKALAEFGLTEELNHLRTELRNLRNYISERANQDTGKKYFHTV